MNSVRYYILFKRVLLFQLLNYCQFREENFNLYDKVNPLDLSYIGEEGIISVLPYREQTGRRIVVFKVGKWDPSKTHMDDLFKASVAALEVGILEPRAQILGGVAIFDMEGLSLQHAFNITPAVVSRVFQIMVTSLPMKVHSIHIINESWIFEKIFSMFKPLLGRRYSESLFCHGSNIESLHKHIEPKYLPRIYGGIRPDYGYIEWFLSLGRCPDVVKGIRHILKFKC
ncbi:hypothetical protein AAG570_001352 [Ranatra chinensis]|uniref:CRAL-TRIO domain-containing protein n=1 Tax=Ranatra chinensis TaxID=642074 RepID=A0ABD0YDI7_9HEMI